MKGFVITCRMGFLLMLISACNLVDEPTIIDNPNAVDLMIGSISFDFPLEDPIAPGRCTRRIDLSLAYTADSLYRKEYLTAANVSDFQGVYTFLLKPGDYFYQAGKSCVCPGDTCLWNGYPGGFHGQLWTMGWFTIEAGKQITQRISFTK